MAETLYGRVPVRNLVGTITKATDPAAIDDPITAGSLPGGGTAQAGIILSASINEAPSYNITIPDTLGDVEGIILGETVTTIDVTFEPRFQYASGALSPDSPEARAWRVQVGDYVSIHDTNGNNISALLGARAQTDTNAASNAMLVISVTESGAIQGNRSFSFQTIQYGGTGIPKVSAGA